MVSACNRLCRMRLLCGPRTEDEELVRGWGGGQWVFGGGSCNGVPPAWGARGSSLCPPAPLCPPSAAARASRRTRAATPPRCCAGGEAAAPEPPPRGGDPKTGPHHKRGLGGAPPFRWDPPIPVASSTWELGLLPGPSAPSPAVLEGRWGSAPGPGSAAGPPPGGSAPPISPELSHEINVPPILVSCIHAGFLLLLLLLLPAAGTLGTPTGRRPHAQRSPMGKLRHGAFSCAPPPCLSRPPPGCPRSGAALFSPLFISQTSPGPVPAQLSG